MLGWWCKILLFCYSDMLLVVSVWHTCLAGALTTWNCNLNSMSSILPLKTNSLSKKLFRAVFPNLGPPDVLGLQLPEAFTTTSAGQDFWELKSKNIWRPKVGDHCYRASSEWKNPTSTVIWDWTSCHYAKLGYVFFMKKENLCTLLWSHVALQA